MNVVNTLARALKGGQMIEQDEEERFVIRLKEADYTNDRLERRSLDLADGSSVEVILHKLTEGLDQVWATWIKKHMPKTMQKLKQRGFIRLEKGPRT